MVLACILTMVLNNGCSVRKYAIHQLGDALARSGSTFSNDEDPELIRQAVPFSLKLIESLLAESPRHAGLLLAAARGFTQYAYAFIQEDADEIENTDLAAANALRLRAKKIYLRARHYGIRGLEIRHPDFEKNLRSQTSKAIGLLTREEVPLLYWTAAAWGSAIALSKDNPELIADVPLVEALILRALELDAEYESGALYAFMVSFEPVRKTIPGDPVPRVRKHFERAMALAKGQMASPLVALAEAVAIKNQDVKEFKSLLNQALAVNPDARPEWRLENLIMQRRARWLLSRVDDLFLVAEPKEDSKNEPKNE